MLCGFLLMRCDTIEMIRVASGRSGGFKLHGSLLASSFLMMHDMYIHSMRGVKNNGEQMSTD